MNCDVDIYGDVPPPPRGPLIEYAGLVVGAILGTLLVVLLSGCDLPTEYTVHSPNCPWPPPLVSDSSVSSVPLGCPYTLENGVVVGGWPR